jgi:hypothetical protein
MVIVAFRRYKNFVLLSADLLLAIILMALPLVAALKGSWEQKAAI